MHIYIYVVNVLGKTLFSKWSTLLNLPQLCPQHKPNARSFSLTQVAAPTHHLSGFDQMATERYGRSEGAVVICQNQGYDMDMDMMGNSWCINTGQNPFF